MTFSVKLAGALHYATPEAAAAAHAAMIEGRGQNPMLIDGARVEGSSIVFAFDGALSRSKGTERVDSTELGIERATLTAITGSVVYTDASGHARTATAIGRPFWYARWENQQIGFHEAKANDLLASNIGALEHGQPLRILVPLAGKAEDMRWLAERGHEVVGVEFVVHAVRAFFDDMDVEPRRHQLGRFQALTADGVTMLCEDFFTVTPAEVGLFDAIYDRGALVALEPGSRERYVATCRALLKPNARTLLIAFGYDQSKTHGPPWSIDRATVNALYGSAELLESRTLPAPPRIAAAGIPQIEECAYLV